MKKILLFLPVMLLAGLFTDAQNLKVSDRILRHKYVQDKPLGMQSATTPVAPPAIPGNNNGPRAALTAKLNSQRISSAGNLLSVLEGLCNQLSVVDSLNLVTFIHRNDPYLLANSTVATYRYDISRNRGLNWTSNIGPITTDPRIDNVIVSGRFPQGVIYNPAGNTVVDSAYLVYAGTWHDNNTWSGQLRGRAQLSGNPATFTDHVDTINNKRVAIATGMCQSQPGVFWNLNTDYSGTFTAGTNAITSGLFVQKGLWNNATKEVDWSLTRIPQTFAQANSGGALISMAYAFTMAFDPSGQYGWIACIADTSNDGDPTFYPLLWHSNDGGLSWSAPEVVDLTQIQGVVERLPKFLPDGTDASGLPTATTQCALTVDVNGNPHLLTTVGNAADPSEGSYDIKEGGFSVWDFTYDPNASAGCKWQGILLGDIRSYIGARTSDQPTYSEDNRPLISRSNDGKQIFFFWTDTDTAYWQAVENDYPNLYGRAIDVDQNKMTQTYSFTEGDTLWNGENAQYTEPGAFLPGASYPTASPIALDNGTAFNIPLVLTQIDYNKTNAGLGSSEQPAAFWYVSNIDFPKADFTGSLDQVPPTITLNGQDSIEVKVNTTYNEAGATAFDCVDGNVTVNIVNAPDITTVNKYYVLYIATDAAGNSDTAVRVVVVGDVPIADFTWNFPGAPNRPKFTDQSQNFATSYRWTFGDNTGTTQKDPFHTYAQNGVYTVCLIATNRWGSDTTCKEVVIQGVGIEETEFAQNISMFPNPSTGKVYLNFEGTYSTDITVSVYNILGETVIAPVTYRNNIGRVELNLDEAASGLYMVKIANDKNVAVKTLSISHK